MGSLDDEGGDREAELHDYLDQLEHALGLVSAYARYEPELTLWCCRRVGELALWCIHISFGAEPLKKRNPTFRELKARGIPDTTLRDILGDGAFIALDVLQNLGNLGVHPRRGAREESAAAVRTAISAVDQVVRALFSMRALTEAKSNTTIRQHLQAIQQGGLGERLDRQYLERLQEELADARAQVGHWKARSHELADHIEALTSGRPPPPNPDQDRLITQLRVALTATEEEAQAARRELLEAQAAQAERDHLAAVAAAESADQLKMLQEELRAREALAVDPAVVTRLRRSRRRLGMGIAVAGGLVGLLVLPDLMPIGVGGSAGLLRVTDATWIPPGDATGADKAVLRVDAPVSASAPEHGASPSLSCRPDTQLVDATSLRLAPPQDRPRWPRPRSVTARTVDVTAFCIDVVPAAADARLRPVDCNPDRSVDHASCVNRRQARDRCSQRGGALPTIGRRRSAATPRWSPRASRSGSGPKTPIRRASSPSPRPTAPTTTPCFGRACST